MKKRFDEGQTPGPGAGYIAKTRLTCLDGTVLALPGERCDRVPASSLPWLIDGKQIVRLDEIPADEGAADGQA